jgi:DNA-directed RNA polymerase subunit alpha
MPVVHTTVSLPEELWHAVQLLASHDGDTNTVVIRALEEYVTATRKRRGRQRTSKYQRLVKSLSTPVAALNLSARPATALRTLNIRCVYELVQKDPTDLFKLPNFGEKSLREVKEKLANLGLTLGMTLDEDSYSVAVVATVATSIEAGRK